MRRALDYTALPLGKLVSGRGRIGVRPRCGQRGLLWRFWKESTRRQHPELYGVVTVVHREELVAGFRVAREPCLVTPIQQAARETGA